MKATQFEFRFRVAIICALYFVGFYAPWERFGANASPNPPRLWSWIALEAARSKLLSVGNAYLGVTIVAIVLATLGALLRVWGTAYLGHFVMRNATMQGDSVMASGPYRYLRNPLYAGTLLTSTAVAVLMPVSGAVVFLVGMFVFTLRLILAEEAYLSKELGTAYAEYRQTVPSVFPALRVRLAPSGAKPKWLQGILAECFPVTIAGCFITLAWSYDADLLTRCVIIGFGVSLIIHALISTRSARGIQGTP